MPNKIVRWISSGVQACMSCLKPPDLKECPPKMKKTKGRRFWMIRRKNKVGPEPKKENTKKDSKGANEKDKTAATEAKPKAVKSSKPKKAAPCEGCKAHSPRKIKARLLQKLKDSKEDMPTSSNEVCRKCIESDGGLKAEVGGEDTMVKIGDDDMLVKSDDKMAKIDAGNIKMGVEDSYGAQVSSYVASVVAAAFRVVDIPIGGESKDDLEIVGDLRKKVDDDMMVKIDNGDNMAKVEDDEKMAKNEDDAMMVKIDDDEKMVKIDDDEKMAKNEDDAMMVKIDDDDDMVEIDDGKMVAKNEDDMKHNVVFVTIKRSHKLSSADMKNEDDAMMVKIDDDDMMVKIDDDDDMVEIDDGKMVAKNEDDKKVKIEVAEGCGAQVSSYIASVVAAACSVVDIPNDLEIVDMEDDQDGSAVEMVVGVVNDVEKERGCGDSDGEVDVKKSISRDAVQFRDRHDFQQAWCPIPSSPLVGERPEDFKALRYKPPRSPKRPQSRCRLLQ